MPGALMDILEIIRVSRLFRSRITIDSLFTGTPKRILPANEDRLALMVSAYISADTMRIGFADTINIQVNEGIQLSYSGSSNLWLSTLTHGSFVTGEIFARSAGFSPTITILEVTGRTDQIRELLSGRA